MEKDIKWDLCSKKFDSVSKLNFHTERQHEVVCGSKKKPFKCNVCGHECSTGEHLMNHIRTHTGERPYKCQINDCGMAFKEDSALKKHIRSKHSDERAYKCNFPGCLRTSKTASDLLKHRKVHSDDRPFPCLHSGCNFRTNRKNNLLQHKANVHSESKAFTCSMCDFKTNTARKLASHMIVHEGRNANIPCTIQDCEYKGKNTKALKEHMRRHKTLLSCPVSGCGRYLGTNKALKDHVKFHNPSGRTFQCPLYLKHFQKLLHLQDHCSVHTSEKPFKCGHCEYTAGKRSHVKVHILSVHPNLAFPVIFHLLDDRECLHCKVILPSVEFLVHSKGHMRIQLS